MPQFIDLTGMRFGKWTAVSYAPRRWECVCECGTKRNLSSQALRTGNTKSCGCSKYEYIRAAAQLRPRAQAKREGKKRFHGTPCKICGGTERLVSTRSCWVCHVGRIRSRRLRLDDLDRQVNAETRRKWKLRNPGRDAEKTAARRAKDDGKYRKYTRSYTALRNARKIKATPSWADLEAIADFYDACPAGNHVDHIVPLRGRNVCGLHVLGNLQYLPAIENIRKHNKFEQADMHS